MQGASNSNVLKALRCGIVKHTLIMIASDADLEKEMATHSSVLAWRIPGTGEPGGLLSMGSHRVGHDWSDLAASAAVMLTRGKLATACPKCRYTNWPKSFLADTTSGTQDIFLSLRIHSPFFSDIKILPTFKSSDYIWALPQSCSWPSQVSHMISFTQNSKVLSSKFWVWNAEFCINESQFRLTLKNGIGNYFLTYHTPWHCYLFRLCVSMSKLCYIN